VGNKKAAKEKAFWNTFLLGSQKKRTPARVAENSIIRKLKIGVARGEVPTGDPRYENKSSNKTHSLLEGKKRPGVWDLAKRSA